MQSVKTIGAILLGIVAFSFVYAKVDATAAMWLALVAGALLLLRTKPRRNAASMGEPFTSSEEAEFHSDDSSASRATARHQTLLDMDQHTYVIMANGRREQERKKRLQAESEVLELMGKNRELETEILRLKKQLSDLRDAFEDPFADPPAPVQKTG